MTYGSSKEFLPCHTKADRRTCTTAETSRGPQTGMGLINTSSSWRIWTKKCAPPGYASNFISNEGRHSLWAQEGMLNTRTRRRLYSTVQQLQKNFRDKRKPSSWRISRNWNPCGRKIATVLWNEKLLCDCQPSLWFLMKQTIREPTRRQLYQRKKVINWGNILITILQSPWQYSGGASCICENESNAKCKKMCYDLIRVTMQEWGCR